MRLALIQNHCSPDRDENLQRALDSMEQAKESGADMVVFPELAIDRFFPQHEEWNATDIAEPIPGPSTNAIGAKAKALSLVTVFNLYEEAVAGRYFDSSPVFDASGVLLGVTRMVHITDYACFHEKAYYHPGDTGARVYDTAVGRIGVAICYDRHYPEYMRALGVHGAQLVAIPQAGAVDEWPEGVFEAEVQAEPVETATSGIASISNWASTPAKLTFRLPAMRRAMPPFTKTPSSRAVMPSISRSRSPRRRTASPAISSPAMRQATPRPTQSGVGSVPERLPRSCPPPSINGTRRTRGRRRT